MSQYDFGTMDPNTKTGTQLAVDLNNLRDAINSLHRGVERPAYAQGGMMWIKEVSSEQWDLLLYDGFTDIRIRSIDPETHAVVPIQQAEVDGLTQAISANQEAATTAQSVANSAQGAAASAVSSAAGALSAANAAQGGVDELNSQIDFTIIYPNGGSAASPANVSINSRYVLPNPFPGYRVQCVAEIEYSGQWGESGGILNGSSTTAGVKAAQLNDEAIIVQTGLGLIMANSNYALSPFGYTGGNSTVALPCRVLVWKSKGAIA